MNEAISPNTRAILLLTAPLIIGRNEKSSDLLSRSELNNLVRVLRTHCKQVADLLSPEADEVLRVCQQVVDIERLRRLLARGFLLGQAIERWQARAIWVVSPADDGYPRLIKERLKGIAPSVLYGCGNTESLDGDGLAVVGSRQVNDILVEYSKSIGWSATRKLYHCPPQF